MGFSVPPAPGTPFNILGATSIKTVQTDEALQLKLQIHHEGVNTEAPVAAAGTNIC